MRVQKIAFHRNGVCGDPFHVVTFTDKGARMVGVVFDESMRTAVFDREMLGAGVIAFGENSHRGDRYDAALRRAIRDREARETAKFYGERLRDEWRATSEAVTA